MQKGSRLAADIGGTFTDVAYFDPATGALSLGKTLSTPGRMVDGIAGGVAKAGTTFARPETFLHGSTVVINTLLERKGTRTALLVTEGFRDIYEIGRINRPDAYNLFFRKHVPLVERRLRFEVRERLTAEGTVDTPLDEDGVHRICDRLVEEGIEAVAILLLHCYANPAHELAVKRIVQQRLPHAFVSASHELSQEYREFERCSTAVANAYVGPIVRRYVSGIDAHLNQAGFDGKFLLVQSTGGLYESQQAQVQCVRMLESGPAAGVIGAHALCRELGLRNAVAFDMGGTTAKAGVIHNDAVLTTNLAMVGGYNEGLPIQIPLVDVFEVGTGGGSIAEVDVGGALHVGPRSAGAEPGPACYGRGGTFATVTDANLVLGRLGVASFLGGEMPLDRDAAATAIRERVARPLGLDEVAAAEGILRIAVTKMSYAVKGVSTERGFDAAAFPLIAYGGAGPLHASAIGREIGMRQLIIPRAPGHFCAFGMLHSDLRYDNVRTTFRKLEEMDFTEVEHAFEELAAIGRRTLTESRVKTASVNVDYAADMRYVGQEHSVTVDLVPGMLAARDRKALKRRFDEVHQQRYGTCAPAEKVEIVTLRAAVIGVMDKPSMETIATGDAAPPAAARRGSREVYYSELSRTVPAMVFDRDRLLAGNRIDGPALVEEHASTTVLLPGDRLEVDAYGNLRIELGGKT
ncbi:MULTISPECIES: hydantoinase/oxoprolinase family protein [Ramlibacter]|uniref:Hydantoinase/oxoprolinase family protein n=1 Tax=Ramlibacter pinisoli TaxID=2682844 RepID=A0A6N8IZB5_9BURK|nr:MULTISPECIES: hydantoinase/oxoprolinase family protein [Ramlibacter]MBA2962176.1 hydantoinase/oxoprolinase family protein [Ramlibacter sp. CGMCC 1.13660]MVQ32118.1 hydantoinase/oxoprolinase family protein [Ramlibacter pinisoli]